MILKKSDMHLYQGKMTRWIIDNLACALWAEPGLGKTVATLTAVQQLRKDFEINRTLIVAPLLVSQTVWPEEIKKWEHLENMTCKNLYWPDTQEHIEAYSEISKKGLSSQNYLSITDVKLAEKERIKIEKERDLIIGKFYRLWLTSMLSNPCTFYTINREQVYLLARVMYQDWNFDNVVLDESSSFKNASSLRWKGLKAVRGRIRRLVELTGTPASRGLLDIWAQIWLIDQGETLYRTFTNYKQEFFNKSFDGYNWEIRAGAKDLIYKKIEHMCLTMLEADYLELPELVQVEHALTLPPAAQKIYSDLEVDFFAAVGDETVAASHSASLHNKLRQVCNGAVYTDGTIEDPDTPMERVVKNLSKKKNWKVVHDEKIDKLRSIIDEAEGEPVLVGYHFKHDGWRIEKAFPKAQRLDSPEKIAAWNRGEIGIAIGHPASMGHGLNLQTGGHILVWFGFTWSLELYDQFWKRLRRQGQTKPVIMHFIFIDNKTERAMQSCLVQRKATQNDLMEAMKKP